MQKKKLHESYRPVSCVETDHFAFNLSVYQGELYVAAGQDGLVVYDLDLNFQRQLSCLDFIHTSSVNVLSDEDVIVCDSYTGLHQLNVRGVLTSTIMSGNFSSSTSVAGMLYALEYKLGKVFVLKKECHKWVKYTQFHLSGYSNGTSADKLYACGTCLYVSSCARSSTLTYSFSGEPLLNTNEKGEDEGGKSGTGNKLSSVFVSNIDSSGLMLVHRWRDHMTQIVESEKRIFSEVNGLDGQEFLLCTAIGGRHLWVGTALQNLVKYEAV